MITASQRCAWCSVLFRPLRPTHRFCSNPCRKRCLAEEMRGRHRRPDEALAARRQVRLERTQALLQQEFGLLTDREQEIAKRMWRLGYATGYGKLYRGMRETA